MSIYLSRDIFLVPNKSNLQQLEESIERIQTSSELHQMVDFFQNNLTCENILSLSEYSNILTNIGNLIQRKVNQILLSCGAIPEPNYIYLYPLFSKISINEYQNISSTILFLTQHYTTLINKSDYEAIVIKNTIFALQIINGNANNGLKYFVEQTIREHIHQSFVNENEWQIALTFFENTKINFDTFYPILNSIFDLPKMLSFSMEERRSILNWTLHVLWNIPSFYNNPSWSLFYEKWKILLYALIELEAIDEVMYVQFFIYHIMGNSFQTHGEWENFMDEISQPCSKMYKNWATKNHLKTPQPKIIQDKIKIAFIFDRIVKNAPFIVNYSLLKILQKNQYFTNNYEICIYNMDYFEKSESDKNAIQMLLDIGLDIIAIPSILKEEYYYHSHLKKALFIREQIINAGTDILLMPVAGYDISDFLISTRVAPKQIFWSHGNGTWTNEEIDMRITHCTLPQKFHVFSVPFDSVFLNPEIPQELIINERSKYPKDAFILGTIGRLVKLDSDEYLESIAKIMHANPHTIYIAGGAGNTDAILKKLEALGIQERWYFPGLIDAHIYGHIIELFCDSWPHTAGNSRVEYMSKGYGVVIFPEFSRQTAKSWDMKFMLENYESIENAYFVAPLSQQNYIENASALINNPDLLRSFSYLQKRATDNIPLDFDFETLFSL